MSIHIEKEAVGSPRFRAVSGNRQSVGRTIGEAVDALLAEWETPVQQAEVVLEEQPEEEYIEPHLVNEGGFWVIAGGKFSPEDAKRDFVTEMREERIRSFSQQISRAKA